MEFETLSIHGGHLENHAAVPIVPPLVLSSTFERGADGVLPGGFLYGRTGNPNRESIEQLLAKLESGAAALAFASGSAAMFAVFHALRPGDHVIAPDDAYHGTMALLRNVFSRWGLTCSLSLIHI